MLNLGIARLKTNYQIKQVSQACFMSCIRCAFQYIKVVLMFKFVNGKIAVQFYDDRYFICNEKLRNTLVSFTMI